MEFTKINQFIYFKICFRIIIYLKNKLMKNIYLNSI